MITMKHVPSGRTMELADTEATKRRILERCGWAQVVEMAEEPVTSLLDDIPEEEEQPNDGSASSPSEDAPSPTTTSDAAAPEAARQPADAPATTKKTKK